MKRTWMFAIILAALYCRAGAEEIIAARISPTGATICFNKTIPSFASALSADKRSLALTFSSLTAPDSIRHILGDKGITEAYWQISNKSAKLLLRFDEKRGYTIAKQPFSRSLKIDIFDWSHLSPADEAYRNALLSEESEADSSATALYEQAFSNGIADAAIRLGIRAAVAGNVKLAAAWLEKARDAGVDSPEITAIYAYIAKAKGDERGAEMLEKRFVKQAGYRLIFDSVGDFPPPNSGDIEGEPLPLAMAMDDETRKDKPAAATSNDLNKRFENIFGNKKHAENEAAESTQSSIFPAWAKTGYLALAAFFCTGGFYIGFIYFRWRSARLKFRKSLNASNSSPSDSDFARELQNAALAQSASRAYSSTSLDISIDGDNNDLPIETPQVKQIEKITATAAATPGKPNANKPAQTEPVSEIEALAGIFPPGEVQLAMRLHSRRRDNKITALQTVPNESIPDGDFYLSQTARSLAVEQNGLSLKKALADDNDHIAKLYRKFGALTN